MAFPGLACMAATNPNMNGWNEGFNPLFSTLVMAIMTKKDNPLKVF